MSRATGEPAFSLPVRIYYEDTDAAGVVYYANYLKFMERARSEWLRSIGFGQRELRRELGVVFAIRSVEIDYLRPALLDDLLRVTVGLATSGRVSMVLVQEVYREADTALCCRARLKVACLDAETLRPDRVPDRVLAEITDAR